MYGWWKMKVCLVNRMEGARLGKPGLRVSSLAEPSFSTPSIKVGSHAAVKRSAGGIATVKQALDGGTHSKSRIQSSLNGMMKKRANP